jgi:flagellar operon protein
LSFRIQNGQIIPSQQAVQQNQKSSGKDFEKAFLEALKRGKDAVKVSAHAERRMEERQISLSEEDIDKINKAMDVLEEKGARESLLLYKDSAFIASISSRTIITAMKSGEIDTVTNIDSAVNIK